MRGSVSARALARGTLLAASAAAASFLIARLGFRREYYAAVLLAVSGLTFLLIAWLAYLRGDGLVRRPGDGFSVGKEDCSVSASGSTPDAEGMPDSGEFALFAPRDGSLVERRGGQEQEGDPRLFRRSFLFAAAELALLSLILYYATGLGARFFL